MVLGNNSAKKPLFTVKVEAKPTGGGSIPPTPLNHVQEAPKSKVTVENMTIDQLLASYKKQDDDDEPVLPGFNYLKKMKNTLKAERVKSVLKR